MRKILVACIVLAAAIGCFFGIEAGKTAYYLNAQDDAAYQKLSSIKKELQKKGKRVILSHAGKFKSGEFTLYAAEDVSKLPEVVDENAINLLWIPKHPNKGNTELLRPYDVVIVKNIPDYSHLKAINVRTAYIPEAIDITDKQVVRGNGKTMYYGEFDGFSPSLYLAGPTDIKIDVFGKGFEDMWDADEIKGDTPSAHDYSAYSIVLADQTEEEIKNEILNDRIREIIANGGLPYIRFNKGVHKVFGDAIPMYHTPEMFVPELKRLLGNPTELMRRKEDIRYLAKQWSSSSQADKIIEIFDIMALKRR